MISRPIVFATLPALLVVGCFEPPTLTPRDAAPRDAPARARSGPLELVEARVLDARGMPWPLEATPRRPTFELELSEPILAPEEAVFLLEGAPSDALVLDAARRPLSRATLARVVRTRLEVFEERVRITPSEALLPRAAYTILLAAFAEGTRGGSRGAAITLEATVSAALDAGARLRASFPADGSLDVPTNVASIALGFDGLVEIVDPPTLSDADGTPIASSATLAPCESIGLEGSACLLIAPHGELPPGRACVVRASGLRDATTAPIDVDDVRFITALERDAAPPTLLAPRSCAIDERAAPWGCVLADDRSVRVAIEASEPVRFELRSSRAIARAVAPRGLFELRLGPTEPATEVRGTLSLTDLAGLVASFDVALSTLAPLAPITITEVCANPRGPEPRQEWIELGNFGDAPVSLEGLAIADRADALGTTITSARVLVPGARVLLVGEGFDPSLEGVPPGAPLVVVGRSIVPSGIANAGEPLYLRDAAGHRLAHVPALPGIEGLCLARRASRDPRGDASEDFDYDACTPGR